MGKAPFTLVTPTTSDTDDIEALLFDPKLGDGITSAHWTAVPVAKPKAFFRVAPDASYRRRAEIVVVKNEGVVEETVCLIGPTMRGLVDGARPCTLVTCVYRDGAPRIWPIPEPRDGEKDFVAWQSARKAAREAIDAWTKIIWKGGQYTTRAALAGYAPDPDFTKLPPFTELLRMGFGANIIRDEQHSVYRELIGDKPTRQSALGNTEELGDV